MSVGAYMPYIPYKRVQIGMGGIYENVPFEVPFSSQANPGTGSGAKYVQTEISVPSQVASAPSSNVAAVSPGAAGSLGGGFEQSHWTVGQYGLGQDPITDLQNGTFLQNYGIYVALALGAYLLMSKKGRR